VRDEIMVKQMKIGNDLYKEEIIEDIVEIDGGPRLKIKELKVLRCHETNDILMDMATGIQRDQKVIAWLLKKYSDLKIPGKIGNHIRKLIGITASEWAELAGIDPSALSHAAQRNSILDKYAAFVLACLAMDFTTGGKQGRLLIEKTQKIGEEVETSESEAVEVA